MRTLVSILALLGVAACTSSSEPIGTDTSIQVLDNKFTPATVNITPGTAVTWTWAGSIAHNVTSDDAAFTASETQTQGHHTVTFQPAGTFHYHCTIHADQGMKGTVVVKLDSLALGG